MASTELSPTADPAQKSEPSVAPAAQNKGKGAEKAKAQEGARQADASKLTGAELKKQAKAEKAARREKAIQEKQAGDTTAPLPGAKSEGSKRPILQNNKLGSTAADVRSLPSNGAPQKKALEDKTVEFFRHLYRNRITSITAVGDEVLHPAMEDLGLKMSKYIICGSCARLVATLEAFKEVSFLCMTIV